MVRDRWQNLNGLWDYAISPTGDEYAGAEGKIMVPFCPESSLSGVKRTVGEQNELWYERTFTIPKEWRNDNIMLHFGAVDWETAVWVNGIALGTHTGGYTPFSFDITKCLNKRGLQTLRVRVRDTTDNSWQPRGKQTNEPMGVWYTAVTGIWQTVWLEPVPQTRILSYETLWDATVHKLTVNVCSTPLDESEQIRVDLLTGDVGYDTGHPSEDVLATQTVSCDSATFILAEPSLWSPDSPYLYGLRICVVKDGHETDSVQGYTALRTISVQSDRYIDNRSNTYLRFALNGKPIFHFGLLDQGWWPDGLYTAPTDDALKFDIEKTKAFGFNMIRKHIKVEPARWYWWCDRLGMMVWQDMPCIADHNTKARGRDSKLLNASHNQWSRDSFIGGTDCNVPQEWKDNYYKEWGEIMESLHPFQCIVVWIPFNEGWGQFDTEQVVAFTRQKDPTRLINESSGGNFHLCGDILDAHHYACPAMNVFEGKKVCVIGEYGGLGLPVKGHLWQEDANWGYGKTFNDSQELLDMYANFAEMLKGFIKTGCGGAVYTQTTDVEIEVNGLMTYDRKVTKVDEARLRTINQAVIHSLE